MKISFFYPDIAVICGDPHYRDDRRDALLNPTVIMEVLSASTEDYDRGRKFKHYREIPSLQDYHLIAQNQMRVEHYTRQTADSWLLIVVSRPADSLTLASIDCTLTLSVIYRKVTFSGE